MARRLCRPALRQRLSPDRRLPHRRGFIIGLFNALAQIMLVVGNSSMSALVTYVVLIFVVDGICFVAQEATWGQTIGKRALGTKVVKTDGSDINVDAALIRYAFLFFSFLGLGGLVTVLMVALSDTKQRIGDRVAGTVVVKVR